MTFPHLARLLLPAHEPGRGRIAHADERWSFDPGPGEPPDTLVWGREPVDRGGADLLPWAMRRERRLADLRLRPPGGLSVTGVHRWVWSFDRPRYLPGPVRALQSGLVVELSSGLRPPRAIDAAAEAAGARSGLKRGFSIGTGGAATALVEGPDGAQQILRVGVSRSAADPSHAGAALRRLEELGSPYVPRLVAQGETASVTWSAETLLPGRTPKQLTAALLKELGEFLVTLPRTAGGATSFERDLHTIVALAPSHGPALLKLLERHAPVARDLPVVMRHGDLWSGNLLVQEGRLSGVVDWDNWAPAAVAGTDLLHAAAMQLALESRRTAAETLARRPWDNSLLRRPAAAYWQALGLTASEEVQRTVGVVWWAAKTAHSAATDSLSEGDATWIARNVVPVLAAGL